MNEYAIMRSPGPRARRSGFASRAWRRMSLVEARSPKEALELYAQSVYVTTTHAQYRAHRLVWVSANAMREVWNEDDGIAGRSRRWRLVVTLANGIAVHDVGLEAWPR